jgi:Cdc6-like AAA superfamily ATPase
LIVDEAESLAYLRQMLEDEMPEGYERLPKLFHKTRLSYNATLLCVLLREELRRFEEDDVHNERCVIEIAALFDQWRTFFSMSQDEVRQRRELGTLLNRLAELGYVRKFSEEPEAWEIRRILKARLPAAELENLKLQLQSAATRRDQSDTNGGMADG